MRELVKDDVVPIVDVGRSLLHVVPREHQAAAVPGFAQPNLPAFDHDPARPEPGRPGDVGGGIDEDAVQTGIDAVDLSPKQQHACLGRDREPNLFSDLEPAATRERLLGEENLDQPLEFAAILRRKRCEIRQIPLEQRNGLGPQRRLAKSSALALLEPEQNASLSAPG